MYINQNSFKDSLFYCSISNTQDTSLEHIIKDLQDYSNRESKQVYILDRILGDEKKSNYNNRGIAVILIPKHKITFLNYANNRKEDIDDFKYEYIDDLTYLSRSFDYSTILGRPRDWKDDEWFSIEEDSSKFELLSFLSKTSVDANNERKIDLLISLAIGSINNIDQIGTDDPQTPLTKVKRKIVLFDGQQTRFIYSHDSTSKRITIQGLAGTGKTELLLNKLKDLYLSNDSVRIAFTCFNKVLATEMKENRIPQFFNFMKVHKQIEWGTRLHVFSSWGSRGVPESGIYSYITSQYRLTYFNYKECRKFSVLCQKALQDLNNIEDFEPCFDYVLIDESQDFNDDFFQLCEKVTKEKVIIAGDIFQDIFDSGNSTEQVDYLLNKCYRTEPKTLMFAHAIGMGLYEKQKFNWLDDDGWKNCGYIVKRSEGKIQLSRTPLRRFEDIAITNTIRFTSIEQNSEVEKTIEAIEALKRDYPDLSPDDIAIIVINQLYENTISIANRISYAIKDKFNWMCNKGFETKKKEPDKIYISNMNNIKGLEFPFVICICSNVMINNITLRNKIYTALTRSFLVSYFLIQNQNNEFFNTYTQALTDINKHGYIEIEEPSDDEKKRIQTTLEETKKQKKSPPKEILEIFFTKNPRVKEYMNKQDVWPIYNNIYSISSSDEEIFLKLEELCKLMS